MSHSINTKPELTVAYQVKDRLATVEWYKKHFGFELVYDVADFGWCEMKSAVEGVFVGFSETENPQVEGGGTLTWGTTDIEADHEYLKGQGIKFDGEIQELPGLVKLLKFYDPDGNHLMLAQSLANPA